MYVQAYSNNDIAFVKWAYGQKINGCLGFCVERIDSQTGKSTVLPAWVGFAGQTNDNWVAKDTSIWPVQKYNWRDFTAVRGRSYTYRITPMLGVSDSLKPSTDKTQILVSNEVTLSPGSGAIKAYFNRGIISTQFVSHQIMGPGQHLQSGMLVKDLQKPGNPLRNALMGQIKEALLDILNLVKTDGGDCYAALYELNDPELIDALIKTGSKLHLVLSNTPTNGDGKTPPDPNSSRARLHASAVDITDRFVANGHIGHNKFLVYVGKDKKPKKILSGSTNWTVTGMCAQSNNAIIIESADLAATYLDYWKRLRAEGNAQGGAFRTKNNTINHVTADGADIDQWFSPNTNLQAKPTKNPPTPSDMNEVFSLMKAAKKSIQFLVFQPGSPSIVTEAAQIQIDNPGLYIRGAATDPGAVEQYDTALITNEKLHPDVVKAPTDEVVAASNITDPFAFWQAELLKASPADHAIIHNKIVVIDAYTDNPVVITGSHNLGFKASYANDENLLIIKGNKKVAEAYSVHVMDVYDHYRWRFVLQQHPDIKDAFSGLKTTDAWQDYYFQGGNRTVQGATMTPATSKKAPEKKVDRKGSGGQKAVKKNVSAKKVVPKKKAVPKRKTTSKKKTAKKK